MVSQEIVLPPRQASYASEGDQDRRGQLADQKTTAKSEYRRHVGSFRCVKVSGTTFLCEPQALRNLRCIISPRPEFRTASRSCEGRAGNAIQTLRSESESAAELNKRNHRAILRANSALYRRCRLSAAEFESLPEINAVKLGITKTSSALSVRNTVSMDAHIQNVSIPTWRRSILNCAPLPLTRLTRFSECV